MNKLETIDAALACLNGKGDKDDKKDAVAALRRLRVRLAEEAGDVERQPYEVTTGWRDGIEESHESFGAISVSRPSGRMKLFGSAVEDLPSFVEIRLMHAIRRIDPELHTEHTWHDGRRPMIAVVRMTTYQWAELISSMNGVEQPCTLSALNGVSMDPVPESVKSPLETIRLNAHKNLRTPTEQEKEFRTAIDGLLDYVSTLGLSKAKEAEVRKRASKLQEMVSAPIEATAWARERMAEDTEKLVSQARVEIAAAFESIARRVGLGALSEKLDVGRFLPAKSDG